MYDLISHLCKALIPVLWFLFIVNSVSVIQWTCIQFLANQCHQYGIFGLLNNFVTLGSPICTMVNTVQLALVKYYTTIWNTAATLCTGWCIKSLAFPKNK